MDATLDDPARSSRIRRLQKDQDTSTFSLELGQWYVVYSKRGREEVVQFYLERKYLDVFFPRLPLLQAEPGNLRIVPLFPSYLFVRIRNSVEYNAVRWTPGVLRVVNFNGHPVPLAEDAVEFLRQQATPAGIITMSSSIRHKEEDVSRHIAGLMHILLNPHDSRDRIRVLMQLLNG
jgi:transcription antitermination factor NusG